MKYKCKLIISVALALLIVVVSLINVTAETIFVYNGYSYTMLSGNYVSVCGWDNRSENFVIPAQLDGSYIKEVADIGMRNNTYITTLDMSPALYMTRIGDMAFKGCSNLSGTVSVPARINEVGIAAFQDCSSIISANYYASTSSVPAQCFYNCSSLQSAIITHGISSIDKLAFARCTSLRNVHIPTSVIYINPTAFDGCTNMKIFCYTDSYAHQYAEEKGIDYVLIDAPAPTEPPTEEPTIAPTEVPTNPATPDQPVPDPTELPTEAIVPILGDADGNGEVDLIDVTLIQRLLAEIQVNSPIDVLMYGDVDGDGELTISDVTFIQRYEAEMESIYPIGQPI